MSFARVVSVEVTIVRVNVRFERSAHAARPAAADVEVLPVVAQGDAYPQLPESEAYGLALGLELL